MNFAGKRVNKSDMLRGAKGIVYFDKQYWASPAIYILLKTERGKALKHLILNIRVWDVDDLKDLPDDLFQDGVMPDSLKSLERHSQ